MIDQISTPIRIMKGTKRIYAPQNITKKNANRCPMNKPKKPRVPIAHFHSKLKSPHSCSRYDKETFDAAFMNARSAVGKTAALVSYFKSVKLDVCAVLETWQRPKSEAWLNRVLDSISIHGQGLQEKKKRWRSSSFGKEFPDVVN